MNSKLTKVTKVQFLDQNRLKVHWD